MRDNKEYLGGLLSAFLSEKGLTLSPEEAAALFEKPADSKMGDLALPCAD